MSAIRGRYLNGTVVLESAAAWPDGTEVVVRLPTAEAKGLRDNDWPNSPEGIAASLARAWTKLNCLKRRGNKMRNWMPGPRRFDDCTIVDTNTTLVPREPCHDRSA
jgi:hypothetical protein